MGSLAIAQFTFGFTLGAGVWVLTYCINRAWLGFWSFIR